MFLLTHYTDPSQLMNPEPLLLAKTFRTILISDTEVSDNTENLSVRNIYSTELNFEIAPKFLVSFKAGFTERTLLDTLLEIRSSLIEFVLFSGWCIFVKP